MISLTIKAYMFIILEVDMTNAASMLQLCSNVHVTLLWNELPNMFKVLISFVKFRKNVKYLF